LDTLHKVALANEEDDHRRQQNQQRAGHERLPVNFVLAAEEG
jgi:hypothetical protein